VVLSHPDSPVGTALRELAERLAAAVSVAALGGGQPISIKTVG
jgi:hypothetical protein